jgi:hypothetical protein
MSLQINCLLRPCPCRAACWWSWTGLSASARHNAFLPHRNYSNKKMRGLSARPIFESLGSDGIRLAPGRSPDLAQRLTRLGLRAEVHTASFRLAIRKDKWLAMVASRWMSLLS